MNIPALISFALFLIYVFVGERRIRRIERHLKRDEATNPFGSSGGIVTFNCVACCKYDNPCVLTVVAEENGYNVPPNCPWENSPSDWQEVYREEIQ